MSIYLHPRRGLRTLRRLLCATLAALSLTAMIPSAAAAGDLSSGGTTVNVTDTTTAVSMAVKMDTGIYWIGCYRDVYQALNLQYDDVNSGLVLDPMNFQSNELWVLKPVSSTSVYFTLAPLSHPNYYIAGQDNDCQLKLSKTSTSDPAVQWMAVPDGFFACGGGAMLIAACEAYHKAGVNYQTYLKVYAEDLDTLCVHMCYIQLSLIGARAIVSCRNSLTMETFDRFITPMEYLWPMTLGSPEKATDLPSCGVQKTGESRQKQNNAAQGTGTREPIQLRLFKEVSA